MRGEERFGPSAQTRLIRELDSESAPDRWPVTISFLADPDGYQIELVERHPEPS